MTTNCLSKMNDGLRKIYRAQDVREETELKMRSYANWGEFLVPGPISIAILGELVFISSACDFPINKHTPDKTYTYIRHPESFRACLMQVCNDGWKAFNTAHKNMDQIRLYSLNIPKDVKMIVQTLMQDNKEIVETMLPVQLRKIKFVADKCFKLAQNVENDYQGLISLISELLENCTSAKSSYQENLKEVERAIKDAEQRKKSAEKAKEMANMYHEDINRQLKEAQEAYKDAIDSMPTGSELVGLSFADAAMKVVTCIPQLLLSSKTDSHKTGNETEENMKQCNMSATRNIVARTEELLSFSKNLLNYTSESKSIDVKKLYDQRSKMVETNWTRDKGFRKLKSLVEKEDDCEIKSCFIKLCNKGIQICDDLEKAVVPGQMDEQKLKNLLTKIQKLNTKTQEFHIASSQLASTPAISPSAPHVSKTFAGMDESGSLVQSTIQLSQMKIAQSKQQLQQSREEYHKTFENLKKCNQEFDEVLIEMRKLQVDKIDFDTTIKMLVKGLDALGRVREQWTKMVQFFQMITNLIETCLNQNISEFVDSCESVRSIPNYSHLDFIKDMIYGPAFQASNVAHLVHMISETYVQVSRLYLMDRMSSLTTLMSLEPNDPKFVEIRRELEAGCNEAQRGIEDLVEKNREEFDASIQKRVDAINKNLESVLPAPSEETSKAIEQCIRKNPVMAIKELSEDDADQFA